jgi:hypothetical protein
MTEPRPGFFARLFLSVAAFFRVLVDPGFAAGVARLRRKGVPAEAEPERLHAVPVESALQLLGLFQQQGRLVDFLQEDVAAYSDSEIGAAVRVVHEGCRRALREHFELEPSRSEAEGARLTLSEGFDPATVRLTGNVVGGPPYSGILVHRGWRVTGVSLPKVAEGHDLHVLAPAELEL